MCEDDAYGNGMSSIQEDARTGINDATIALEKVQAYRRLSRLGPGSERCPIGVLIELCFENED